MPEFELSFPEAPIKRRAIGIDLGTTHSLVALDSDGKIEVLKDENNQPLLPSCVRYCESGACIVGIDARAKFIDDPQNTIISVKRLIGRTPQEALDRIPLPYEFVDVNSRLAEIKTRQGPKNPIIICAEILKKLIRRAQAIDSTICDAVITVPAYFDDAQRQATKDAAKLAGINVLRLINEPTAAAIAYGLDSGASGYCLVYDLGGGTFDVSILQLTNGVFQILATGGDTALGGDDLDYLVAQWLIAQTPNETLSIAKALEWAKYAKESLSTQAEIEWRCTNGFTIKLTRAIFDELIQSLVSKTLMHCQTALKDSHLTIHNIDHIVLVGGSTRIPFIRQKVAEYFGKTPLTNIDPDTVVAIGAAIQASLLSGHRQSHDLLLLDVIPLSLGIEMMGGVVDKLLMRNTPIPAQVTETFTTFQDNQTGIILHIVQGERENAKDCRSLATLELTGLPLMPAGKARVEVTFKVDMDGLLSVSAKELITGLQTQIDVKPTYGLSQQEVFAMIKDSIAHAQDDLAERKMRENIQRIDQLLVFVQRIEKDKQFSDAHKAQLKILKTKFDDLRVQTDNFEAQFKSLENQLEDLIGVQLNQKLEQTIVNKSFKQIDTFLT